MGTAYGHIALGVPDAYAACEKIKAAGGNVTREAGPVKGGSTVIAFVTDPDGYKVELIQRAEYTTHFRSTCWTCAGQGLHGPGPEWRNVVPLLTSGCSPPHKTTDRLMPSGAGTVHPLIDEPEWRLVMVDPLPRLVRAVVPGRTRGGGKIVVMGSASALRA
jgi:hypothetical protein